MYVKGTLLRLTRIVQGEDADPLLQRGVTRLEIAQALVQNGQVEFRLLGKKGKQFID